MKYCDIVGKRYASLHVNTSGLAHLYGSMCVGLNEYMCVRERERERERE